MVGIAVGGKPVGGVIHQPFYEKEGILGRTIWGIPGVGIGGIKVTKPKEGVIYITTTKSHSSPKVEETLAAFKPNEVLRVGGAGYKAIILLEGKAHAYIYPSSGCKKWDTCASEAVLAAAGGWLTDMSGLSYQYDTDVGETFQLNF